MQPDNLEWIFILPGGSFLKFSKDAADHMLTFKQSDQNSKEAGGIMIGRFLKESNDVVVDSITVPMNGDIRKRYYYCRKSKMHQKIADINWNESMGRFNYIGEWHTHAELNPKPSSFDIVNWNKKLNDGRLPGRYIYFAILGIDKIQLWQGDKITGSILNLLKQ